jgi:hypothetical protein
MNTLRRFHGLVSTPLALLVCAGILVIFTFGACKKQTAGTGDAGSKTAGSSHQEKSGKVYTPAVANCNGFTAADAASILGLPAAKVTAKTEELYAGNWQCLFDSGDAGKTISFNVSVAKSVQEASRDMEQYRSHLETAGEVEPFKENLPKGAYSDIGGLGDDGVWTDINLSLAIRKGNVTIQVSMPKDKMVQMKVAEKFLSTLK